MKRTLSFLLLSIMLMSAVFAGSAVASAPEKITVIVGFKGLPDAALIHAHGGDIIYQYSIINAIACTLPPQAIEALQKNPNVAYVEQDQQATALEYGYPTQDWGITKIGANTVHPTDKGSGVKVAVIDTGINYQHIDLALRYIGGHDYVNNDNDPFDDNGHGTHCAGIIAASINGIAVVGVAPEASILSYKVLNSKGSGTYTNIIAGINQAVLAGAQVISMSLGGTSYSQSLYDACFAAKNHGVVVVCAAGNSGNTPTGDTVNYPGRFDCVIAVGATDVNDNLATFSSTGPEVDVAAPGVSILSDYRDVTPTDGKNQDTIYMSGTSMACPHVAGTAALMLKVNPSLTPSQVQSILQDTALDRGTTGFDNYYGWGRIDAAKAVAASTPVTPPGPDTTPPAQVQGLNAQANSDTKITLTWNPNTESDLKGYYVYKSTDGGATYNWIATINAPTSSFPDTGLQASTKYYYEVSAFDLSGNVGDPASTSTTTLSQPQTLHAAVTVELKTSGRNTFGVATITITDVTGKPLPGAVVTGVWSGATKDTDTGITGSNGIVTFQSNNVKNARAGTIFTLTVTSVTLSGYVFEGPVSGSATK